MSKVEAAQNWNSRVTAVDELQRELAFYFGQYHGTRGHRLDALACMENECVRVRNLCLAPTPENSHSQKPEIPDFDDRPWDGPYDEANKP